MFCRSVKDELRLMKICTVVCTLNPVDGGMVTWVKQLHRNLVRSGHELQIVTLDEGNEAWYENIGFSTVNLGPSALGRFRYSQMLLSYLRDVAERCDAILTHGIWTYPPIAVHEELKRRPGEVVHINLPHGDLDPNFRTWFPAKHYFKKKPFYKFFGAKVLKACDGVLFTSLEEKKLAAVAFPDSERNQYVIRYGIELPPEEGDVTREIRQLIEGLGRRRKLLYFGRIHPKKGPDLLIKAFSRVAQQHQDLHLIMAGAGDEAFRASLEDRANALDLAGRISWTGSVVGYSKWHLYRNADAYILPSHTENFGITVAEAMSVGIPVLISNKVNIHPDIAAHKAGLVAPDTLEGTESLFRKWLAMSSEEAAVMGLQGKALVSDRFQAHQSAEDLVKICETLRNRKLTKRRAA